MSYKQFTETVEQNIKTHGCNIVSSYDSKGRVFSYTIGLTDRGWPELIISGPPPEVAGTALNRAVAELKSRCSERGPTPGDILNDPLLVPVELRKVDPRVLLGYMAQAVYRQERVGGPAPEALQVVWPDELGLWPGEEGCNANINNVQILDDLPGVH